MQDWDEHAIAMLDRCPSAKCFLSHYPPATGDPGLQVPVLCMSHFDEGAQMPSFEARNFDLQVRPASTLPPSHRQRLGERLTRASAVNFTCCQPSELAVAGDDVDVQVVMQGDEPH